MGGRAFAKLSAVCLVVDGLADLVLDRLFFFPFVLGVCAAAALFVQAIRRGWL